MANYQQTNVSGEKYKRANRILLENPYNEIPRVTFQEEEVITLGDETIRKPSGVLTANFSNPSTEFNLLNPIDNSVIGTAKYQDLYVLIYSLYLHLAQIRDNP